MTKSDGEEFEVVYHNEDGPVTFGKAPHSWVVAVSESLRVITLGEDAWVAQRRQIKLANGRDPEKRTMLVVNLGDAWIHILGDLIVVAKQKLRLGQIEEGLHV